MPLVVCQNQHQTRRDARARSTIQTGSKPQPLMVPQSGTQAPPSCVIQARTRMKKNHKSSSLFSVPPQSNEGQEKSSCNAGEEDLGPQSKKEVESTLGTGDRDTNAPYNDECDDRLLGTKYAFSSSPLAWYSTHILVLPVAQVIQRQYVTGMQNIYYRVSAITDQCIPWRSIVEEPHIGITIITGILYLNTTLNKYGLGWMGESSGVYFPEMVQKFYASYTASIGLITQLRKEHRTNSNWLIHWLQGLELIYLRRPFADSYFSQSLWV